MKMEKGFTLLELLIVVFFVGGVLVVGVGVFGIAMGNFWWNEEGVLKELRVDHPKVERIVKTERNVYADSVIIVDEEGSRVTYALDSDFLWNYKFTKKKPQ